MILKLKITLLILILAVLFTSCDKNNSQATLTDGKEALGLVTNKDEEEVIKDKNLAIVTNVNIDDKKVIIYLLASEENIVLTYSGGTSVLNKYNEEMTMAQIETGEIVEVDYKKGTQKLTKIKISEDAWEYSNVSNIEIDTDKSIIVLGSNNFRFTDNDFKIFSGNFEIDINELNKVDELIVRGINKTVYSIEVEKGHGYIKVENADYFLDGMIEVGTKNINLITKDMVIVAAEGDYILTATKNGVGGSQSITVTRNEELVVDISNFQEQAVRIGNIKFNVTPRNALLYIDGKKTDYSSLVSLSYGSHTINIILDGYNSYTETLVVNSIYQNKDIILSESEVEVETSEAEEETEDSSSYYINVNTPVAAEVYFDGVYKGITPVSFSKETGSHTIVLRKTGYVNKSYTVYITSDLEDVEFSFPDLVISTE